MEVSKNQTERSEEERKRESEHPKVVNGGTFKISNSTETNDNENKDPKTGSVENEDNEEKDEAKSWGLRFHMVKVGIFDVFLYIADVVTDAAQCATHYFNCHYRWATATAVFVFLPSVAEAFHITCTTGLNWLKKDIIFRTLFGFSFSMMFFALIISLTIPLVSSKVDLASEAGNLSNLAHAAPYTIILGAIFLMGVENTLKGYASLMTKKPNKDGTVSDPQMLEGLKGKLKEVICESAPQGNLQVRSLCNNISA